MTKKRLEIQNRKLYRKFSLIALADLAVCRRSLKSQISWTQVCVFFAAHSLVSPERCAQNTVRERTSSGFNTARSAGAARPATTKMFSATAPQPASTRAPEMTRKHAEGTWPKCTTTVMPSSVTRGRSDVVLPVLISASRTRWELEGLMMDAWDPHDLHMSSPLLCEKNKICFIILFTKYIVWQRQRRHHHTDLNPLIATPPTTGTGR